MTEAKQTTFVLYHGPHCADGFAAAWSAAMAIGRGDNVKFIPVNYGEPVPEIPDGAVVYILDFSYPREILLELAGRASRVVVLDHHRTAQQALEGLDGTVPGLTVKFDMEKSGAVLAWEYFCPGETVPILCRYVQDRDLWQWKLPNSREVSAALALEPRDFSRWSYLEINAEDLDADPPDGFHHPAWKVLVGRGQAILEIQAKHIESIAKGAFLANVGGHRVPVVSSPLYQSELGERLCHDFPDAPFAGVFSVGEHDELWSLRSRNGFDVSAVAKSLGGGGHAAAAGFRRPRVQLEVT